MKRTFLSLTAVFLLAGCGKEPPKSELAENEIQLRQIERSMLNQRIIDLTDALKEADESGAPPILIDSFRSQLRRAMDDQMNDLRESSR